MVVSRDRDSEEVVYESDVGKKKKVHVPNGGQNGPIALVRYDSFHRQKEAIVDQVLV